MPELPEVQALAERLTEAVGGSAFEAADREHLSTQKNLTPHPTQLHRPPHEPVGRPGK